MRIPTRGPQDLDDAVVFDPMAGVLAVAPTSAHTTRWDRAVVIALGGAGCVLSYDALQQMAVAVHVRGPLTYLFPLVIDGFIAFGVRALLVLRDAPLRARLYVWMLFGTATAVSVWANAVHAVRFNQQVRVSDGLRLSDAVVAVLSTIAPLALAGAVHLYILIARGAVKDRGRPAVGGGDRSAGAQAGRSVPGPVVSPDRAGHRQVRPDPVEAGGSPADTRSAVKSSAPMAGGRPGGPGAERMLEIARSAVKAEGKLTREVVARAIRGRQIPVSSGTLTALMAQLREQHERPEDTPLEGRPHHRDS